MYGKLVLMVGILYVAKNGYYSCITLSYNYIQKVVVVIGGYIFQY